MASRGLATGLFGLALAPAIACADAAGFAAAYPKPDPFLGEQLQENEIEDAQHLIQELSGEVRDEFQTHGHARRDAHAKAHGCVAARLDVDKNIPAGLARGLFQPGASYAAKVRFSNGTPRDPPEDADIRGDMRGMAIKLYGVPGKKLFSLPGREDEHDMILISAPYFFFRGAHGYAELFETIKQGGLAYLKLPFVLGLRASYNAWRMLHQHIANPLTTRYWSLVPYQLGVGEERKAVKYSAIPCAGENYDIPKDPPANYLREAMATTLRAGPACMDFMVQTRTDPSLSVEEVLTAWPEERAAFRHVARITIPKQAFATPQADQDCENESYNPWQALPEHKPLGGINRTRFVLYQAISDLRHDLNKSTVPGAR